MIALLLSSLAFAFQPSQTTWIGIEPNRIQYFDATVQHNVRKQSNWQNFLQKNPSWNARFDQRTQLPYRAWGKGIAFDVSSSQALETELREWIDGQELFGVKSSSLRVKDLAQDSRSGRWYVHFDQVQTLSEPVYNEQRDEVVREVVLWRSGVDFRLQETQMTQFTAQTHPDVKNIDWVVSIDAIDALDIAQMEGPATASFHWNKDVELVILPWERRGVLKYRLCLKVSSETESPLGQWVSFVDAETGALLNTHNEIRFFDGTILGEHDTRTVDGNFSISPLPLLNINGSELRTDVAGFYSWATELTEVELGLEGRRVKVLNEKQNSSELQFSTSGEERILTSDDGHQAEIDQYVFQNQIYAWAAEWAPQIPNQWTQATVNVNLEETCNAHFDGELNFYQAGDGCNNTGRISDIAFHEWGHGFHYYNLLSGEFDGAMSEGIGDTISFFQTNDYRLAPYFGQNGRAIREVETNYSYPEDVVGEVHQDGLIFAGAVWDLWGMMKADMGEEVAYQTLMPIFVDGLRGGPTIPEVFDEFVFADDDDGDLSNGTPNLCLLVDAFALHGLGFNGGGGLYSLSHDALSNQVESSSGFPVVADIEIFAEQCVTGSLDSSMLHYSIDGGSSWEVETLDIRTDLVEGFIPPVMAGTEVLYYISMEDSDGNEMLMPSGAEINPYSFYVGELEEIYCTDFEADDGGFTHSLISGEEIEGADDWQWGTPAGLGGDPSVAASGSNIWGNDLGGGEYNGEYQNERHNQLLSANYDISDYETVVLSYDRWLTVEDGEYDQAIIMANESEVWSNHSSSGGDDHHRDEQWQNHSLAISTNGNSYMQFAWEISSDQGLTMGGWNIDNFCLYGVVIPDEEDANLDGEEGGLKANCSAVSSSEYWLWSLGLGVMFLGQRRRR